MYGSKHSVIGTSSNENLPVSSGAQAREFFLKKSLVSIRTSGQP